MKKFTLFFISAILFTAFTGAQSLTKFADKNNSNNELNPSNPTWWTCDSTYHSQWNESTLAWDLFEKEYQHLDGQGNFIMREYINWNPVTSQWEPGVRYRNEHYDNNAMKARYKEMWNPNDNIWIDLEHSLYNPEGRITENQYQSFSILTNEYTSGSKTAYTYGTLNEVYLGYILDVTTMTWNPLTKTTLTYNAENQLIEEVDQSWNDVTSEWVNSIKIEFSYGANGLLQKLIFSWNNVSNTWDNYHKYDYTYNSSGYRISLITYEWNSVTSLWDYLERELAEYNASNNKTLESTDEWNATTSSWDEQTKALMTYYTDNRLEEKNGYVWNPYIGDWIESSLERYDESGNQVRYLYKSIDMTTYSISYGYQSYSVFENNRIQENLSQNLNLTTFNWEEKDKRTWTYDGNDNCSQEMDESYDLITSNWKKAFLQEHYYSDFIGIEEHGSTRDYCVFSNPIRSGQTINCDKLTGKTCVLNLINMNGQTVYTTIINGKTVSTPALAAGEYIMQIIPQGEKPVTGKILVVN